MRGPPRITAIAAGRTSTHMKLIVHCFNKQDLAGTGQHEAECREQHGKQFRHDVPTVPSGRETPDDIFWET